MGKIKLKNQQELCSHHKPVEKPYMNWMVWAEQQLLRGIRQEQCPDCKRWLFPVELGSKPSSS